MKKRNRHTVLLHDGQELEDDLGAWSDEDLTLAGLFSIVDALQAIVKDALQISMSELSDFHVKLTMS